MSECQSLCYHKIEYLRSAMSGNKVNNTTRQSSNRNLLSREEHYKQLNEELSAKTANLVQEAEAVLRGQESLLSQPSMLDKIGSDELALDWDNDGDYDVDDEGRVEKSQPVASAQSRSSAQTSSRSTAGKTQSTNRATKTQRTSGPKRVGSQQSKTSRTTLGGVDDVALVDTPHSNFSLQKTISTIEQRLNSAQLDSTEDLLADDDVIPSVANEMGTEAQIRFLKAKLRVMQEEMDRLSSELMSKEEKLASLQNKIKELDEEKGRLQRTNAAQHTQLDKYKKLAEDSKSQADSLDSQVTALRKELESLKRNQKQQSTNQSATEVRLNQAREDVQKYKSQLQKVQGDAKESLDHEKTKVEQLMVENKRLEKQKNELLNGFKKQLKLIDVLKRQKMHLEAARMLNFTEEEFVKALEWNN